MYLLIKYIKSILWRVAKRLSYIEDARCLKVNILISNKPAFWCLAWHRLSIEAPSLLTPTAGVLSTMPAHSYYINYSMRPATQLLIRQRMYLLVILFYFSKK